MQAIIENISQMAVEIFDSGLNLPEKPLETLASAPRLWYNKHR
jgi:hypothetical protein